MNVPHHPRRKEGYGEDGRGGGGGEWKRGGGSSTWRREEVSPDEAIGRSRGAATHALATVPLGLDASDQTDRHGRSNKG